MAAVPKRMFRGALTTTTTTTLGTVTTGKTWIVTNVWLSNNSGTDATATIALAGTAFLTARTVPANGAVAIDCRQVLDSTETITGGASVGSSGVTCHVSGVEV